MRDTDPVLIGRRFPHGRGLARERTVPSRGAYLCLCHCWPGSVPWAAAEAVLAAPQTLNRTKDKGEVHECKGLQPHREEDFGDQRDLLAPEAPNAGGLLRTEPSKCQGAFPMAYILVFNRQVESRKQEAFAIPINFNTVACFILKLREK